MILPRLVLGTARIAGGADQQRGVTLIRSALDLGMTHIDTAPSYGMGTAEGVVGQALAGYDHVGVSAKLGSPRPAQPWLRTAVRRIKRAIGSADTPAFQFPPARIEQPCGNDFSPAAMARSLALSRERLGRIGVLLLHDISADEVTGEVLGNLVALAATAQAAPGAISQPCNSVDGIRGCSAASTPPAPQPISASVRGCRRCRASKSATRPAFQTESSVSHDGLRLAYSPSR